MRNIRFIQFPHPGREHRVSPGASCKQWNPLRTPAGTDNPHARTFFQVSGKRVTRDSKEQIPGLLWAWGEWEAEASVVKSLEATGHEPFTLFKPYWKKKEKFDNHHNTDPFVFGGFYYTDCKQGTSSSLMGMLELDIGSVIIFGSGESYANEARWVVDTVFVVREFIDHDDSNYKNLLSNKTPPGYDQIVLGPIYGPCAPKPRRPRPRRRLYIGATFENQLDGMFSFFPCMAAGSRGNRGFARPQIKISRDLTERHFNPKLRQGMKGQGQLTERLTPCAIKSLWVEICKQVQEEGCDLGVWADPPCQRD